MTEEQTFDVRFWSFVFDIVQWLVAIGAAVYAYSVNRRAADREKLRDVEGRVDRMEVAIEHMPIQVADRGKADRQLMWEAINTMNGILHELTGSMKAVQRQLDMVQQNLLERK